MQIVIDIPIITLLNINSRELLLCSREDIEKLEFAIKNGTPLPKGHGRLIDMKKLQKFVSHYTEHDAVQLIFADREDYLPTIIEADRVESEGKE